MAIQHRPKTGEILECNFGQHVDEGNGTLTSVHFDGHINPEMIKRRLVLVINGKLSNSCVVIPISSKMNPKGIREGWHIEIESSLIPVTQRLDVRRRWIKADTIQNVSNKRLFRIRDNGQPLKLHLPRDVVEEVQRAVISVIKAKGLLN